MTDPEIVKLAELHLSAKQFQAWKLIHVHGMSLRAAATHLAVHRTTFTDRYDAACLNLKNRAGVAVDASGKPYLEETPAA